MIHISEDSQEKIESVYTHVLARKHDSSNYELLTNDEWVQAEKNAGESSAFAQTYACIWFSDYKMVCVGNELISYDAFCRMKGIR